MSKTKLALLDYVMSGYPAIIYRTSDEWRTIKECMAVAEQTESKFVCWSQTNGFYDPSVRKNEKEVAFKYNEEEYNQILIDGLNKGDGSPVIFCLLDFHHYLKSPQMLRTAKDVFLMAKEREVTYVFISENFEVSADLKHEMVILDKDLPSKTELQTLIESTIQANDDCEEVSEEDIKKATNALAMSFYKTHGLDFDIIYDIKKQIICQDNLIEVYNSNETMDSVGGMQAFKDYAKERSFSTFSEEAREYGLPYPKGVLLFGIPGCGKSLAAKALANMWKVPLLKLDLGKLFASLVGETEANTRRALQTAESMAPCVVWLDEIDKALAGTSSSGKTDSGVTARMFGSILTWMQEKESAVYVIATANNINLPPEFLRKGRFDEMFFVDLPNSEERKEIFKIQIKKHKRNPEDFDIEKLSEKSEEYNGAEIEECIVSSMFRAWNDGKRPYTTEDIIEAMLMLKPAAQGIMQDTVGGLRNWSQAHNVRNANTSVEIQKVIPKGEAVKPVSSKRTKRATMI